MKRTRLSLINATIVSFTYIVHLLRIFCVGNLKKLKQPEIEINNISREIILKINKMAFNVISRIIL